jgi:hypothetical protein
MARASGKAMKVDVALPLDIFETVVRLAEESNAPIHHRSNQRVLSTTIIRLIGLGIQSIADNPELLTASISGGNGLDPRVTALVDRIGKLEDDIKGKKQDIVTRDDVQSMIDEAVQLLQAAGLDSSGEDELEDEDEFIGWGFKEFSDEQGIAAKDGAAVIREALVTAGLDSQVSYNSSSKKFFPIEAE